MNPINRVKIEVPKKILKVFEKPRGDLLYRGAFGGRGSGKSFNFALMALLWGYIQCLKILCTRQFECSIKDSFHAELKSAIEAYPWLQDHYIVTDKAIVGRNGTEFIFKGLDRNINSIASIAQVDLTIVEEGEDVPEHAWIKLEPTVLRTDKPEIWVIWNPKDKDSPVDKRFRQNATDDMCFVEMNHRDNPFFPEALEKLRLKEQRRLDPDTYNWVWEGKYLQRSESRVFHNYVVEEFEYNPVWGDPIFGADWGFAADPTTLIKMYYDKRTETLYISHEAWKVHCEVRHTAALFDTVPESRDHKIRADSARPEVISHMKFEGFNIEGVSKAKFGTDSNKKSYVEGGVAWLQGRERIVIHPRCVNMAEEARLYSYKCDKLTGDVKNELEDKDNHGWDATRYGMQPLIEKNDNCGVYLL